jgi:hypothetical protein
MVVRKINKMRRGRKERKGLGGRGQWRPGFGLESFFLLPGFHGTWRLKENTHWVEAERFRERKR